jgi:hypothetical protein
VHRPEGSKKNYDHGFDQKYNLFRATGIMAVGNEIASYVFTALHGRIATSSLALLKD